MRFLSYSGLLVALLALFGCGGGEAAAEKPSRPPVPVTVVKALHRRIVRKGEYLGYVEPVRVARMASPAEGPIEECVVREGDAVVAGQVLVRIGRAGIRDFELVATQEELVSQQADMERIKQLVGIGALPAKQLEVSKAAVKRAKARLAMAETSVADHDVKAPWDGVVSKVWISDGNYVSPRTPLLDIYDPDSLRVKFYVPERDSRLITVGAAAEVCVETDPRCADPAVVERIYPRIDPLTRTLTAEAKVVGVEIGSFIGLSATVSLPLQSVDAALTIPSIAVLAMPDGASVVYTVAEGVAAKRVVEVGIESDGWTQILTGVDEGDTVVVRGQERLSDGANVRIMGGGGKAVDNTAVEAKPASESQPTPSGN